MRQLFVQMDSLEEDSELAVSTPLQHWMQAIEDAVEVQVSATRHVQWQQQIVKRSEEMLSKLLVDTQTHTQWLQNEWHAAKEHESRLQAHAEWLQSEWDAAKAKVDELNQSSHHWRTVADQHNQELQWVYGSLSWRLTALLRKVGRFFK